MSQRIVVWQTCHSCDDVKHWRGIGRCWPVVKNRTNTKLSIEWDRQSSSKSISQTFWRFLVTLSEAWKVKRIGVAPDGDKEKKYIPDARTEMIIKKRLC